MKLVKFNCTVAVIRAQQRKEDVVAPHAIWINPEEIQMVVPESKERPEEVTIFFRGDGGSTGVEGTFAEVIEKLTTA